MLLPNQVQCCIAGGGPAGLMLGVLLARAGVRVLVLEKHADFLRDFRGDTIHPSTLQVMYELGWLDRFLKLPHQQVPQIFVQFGDFRTAVADFSTLPVKCPYIAMMPQWDFLDFLADEGLAYPGFTLAMNAEAFDIIESDGRVAGLSVRTLEGEETVRADLVVAADGRGSVIRERAGFKVETLGAPMDVLWFRLSRRPGDTEETQGRFDAGRIFIMLNRGDYWQCAFVIAKGSLVELKARGLDEFRKSVAALTPFADDRGAELKSWDDIKLLTVMVDRLTTWHRPGLLCIGDAAHAMSPVGGVGVNLAVQDAVAAANILAEALREGRASEEYLAAVQRRRMWPTRVTQALQVGAQNNVIAPTLAAKARGQPPLVLRMLQRFPILRRIPARLIGLGVRREHVSPAIRDATGKI